MDFYEEGMTPLLSYMFFVLHYHENLLTTEKCISGPVSRTAKCSIILIALCSPGNFLCRRQKSSKMRSRKFCDSCCPDLAQQIVLFCRLLLSANQKSSRWQDLL